MKKLGLNEIRKKYLDYFDDHEHLVQPSYPLVPQNDNTLMFIVAGMVPFKDFFSGLQTPPRTRMATSQKCIRTNDIDNVGRTARHASFFEMLGNFSFGDYFKSEAIKYAWDFVINHLEMEKDKLWISIYEDDDEAFEIWTKQEGVPADRIVRMGKEDNFWEMGTAGPCGPCSEIYYDRGEKYNSYEGECKPGGEGDRFIEFWNLVFTQFDKDESGELHPLKKKNIDTGMGLERLACIMQDVESIFDVDVFRTIINSISEISGVKYGLDEEKDISMRVITDHMRAVTFLITDGVVPDNEGRGYVLRRLLRRSARHGRLLGVNKNFLSKVADTIINVFGEAYPDLLERADYTKNMIELEEQKFSQTIDSGLSILEKYIEEMKKENLSVLSGDRAFKLYDTYGFPLDLTMDILKDHGIEVNESEFDSEMQAQRDRARAARGKVEVISQETSMQLNTLNSKFVGYEHTMANSKIVAIIHNSELQENARSGENIQVVLDITPFYAESGGQIGDVGTIVSTDFDLEVYDVKKLTNGTHIHYCNVSRGDVSVGANAEAVVDFETRNHTLKNHSATHLLHKALQIVLGDSVAQAGSYVGADRLRFDFTHFKAMSKEQIKEVENIVNREILLKSPVFVDELPKEEALKTGAKHLFNEKYGDVVRVVRMGTGSCKSFENASNLCFSVEFCGGTHCDNTSEIGLFKIMSESAVASGVRRIEAITGKAVYEMLNELENLRENVAEVLKTNQNHIIAKIDDVLEENFELKQKLNSFKGIQAAQLEKELKAKAVKKDTISIIKESFVDEDMDMLKDLAHSLANVDESMEIVFSNVVDDKVSFIVKLSKSAVKDGWHAGKIAKSLAQICGGGGGGKPEMAQSGGKDITKLSEAMQSI